MEQLHRLSAATLVPLRGQRPGGWHDETGALLPPLEWYPRLIRDVDALNTRLTRAVAERALPGLESTRDSL